MSEKHAKKILIVDDEPDIVQVLEVQLKGVGYITRVARDGKEALEKVSKEKPDLIILDIIMPHLDGFGVYKALRAQKETANIPIIILTARGKMEDTFKVMGVDEFIAKPFDMNKLMAAIGRLLSASAKAPSAPVPAASAPAVSAVKDSILIAGHPSEHLTKFIAFLKSKKIEAFVVESDDEVMSKCAVIKPKAIILDVYLNESSSEDTVKTIRENASLGKVPIILYSHIDTHALGGDGLSGRILSIDTAKENCMTAGATSFVGQLTDKNFFSLVFVSLPQ